MSNTRSSSENTGPPSGEKMFKGRKHIPQKESTPDFVMEELRRRNKYLEQELSYWRAKAAYNDWRKDVQ
jgi:hypothetical protein